MDKVQKIREEVARVQLYTQSEVLKQILDFIDSLQEEPAPKIFEDMLNAITPAESLGISAEEHEKIIDLCLYGKELEMVDIDDLPKEEPVSEEFEKIVEEIAEPTILNAYGTKELARRLRNTICGTSVSEDLELGWEDISIIRQIMFDYNRQVRNEISIPNDKEYCEEILKRFKERKETKD